jgi:hypothetical protein
MLYQLHLLVSDGNVLLNIVGRGLDGICPAEQVGTATILQTSLRKAGTPAILIEFSVVYLSPHRKIPGYYLN